MTRRLRAGLGALMAGAVLASCGVKAPPRPPTRDAVTPEPTPERQPPPPARPLPPALPKDDDPAKKKSPSAESKGQG